MTLKYIFLLVCTLVQTGLFAQTRITSAQITFTFVTKKVNGSISGFTSTSSIDLNDVSKSKFRGAVAVETLKTGNFLRDWSLRSGKYFDADTYPLISFESRSVTPTATGIQVKGTLTIKDISKSIRIDLSKKANTLTGTTTLFSSDFGIHIKKQREDNKVEVQLELTLD